MAAPKSHFDLWIYVSICGYIQNYIDLCWFVWICGCINWALAVGRPILSFSTSQNSKSCRKILTHIAICVKLFGCASPSFDDQTDLTILRHSTTSTSPSWNGFGEVLFFCRCNCQFESLFERVIASFGVRLKESLLVWGCIWKSHCQFEGVFERVNVRLKESMPVLKG